MINENQAYIAVREDGFVDGICLTAGTDGKTWCREMRAAGFQVQIRDRAEAKKILFTYIDESGIMLA